MKKILFDDTELEYDIFQSKNKEPINSINSIEDKLFLFIEGLLLMPIFQ